MDKISDYIIKTCFNRLYELELSDAYVDRLVKELNVLIKEDRSEYLYIVHDYCKFCKENNIHLGYGRGSSVGSLVVYLLDITKIDPIKYDLSFERFASGHDADIDIDIDPDKRHILMNYLNTKYKDHIWYIYDSASNGINRVNTNSICIDLHNDYNKFIKNINGVNAINRKNVPHKNKYDILSSRVVNKYFNIIDKVKCTIDFNDSNVWNTMNHVDGLFNIGTEYSANFINAFYPKSIMEIVEASSLIRSNKEKQNEYLLRRNRKRPIEKINSIYDSITKDTYGMIIFQEQFLKLMSNYVSPEEAYKLMKDKDHKYINTIYKIIKKTGFKKLKDIYYDATKYSYNKSHAVAYAYLTYIGAYLRYYYPDYYNKNYKSENLFKNQMEYIYLTINSEYETKIENNKIILGFDKILTEKEYILLKQMNNKNFFKILNTIQTKKVIKLIKLNIFESIINLNNVDLFNYYMELKNSKTRISSINVDKEQELIAI